MSSSKNLYLRIVQSGGKEIRRFVCIFTMGNIWDDFEIGRIYRDKSVLLVRGCR
jgi:hypothetical protein